MGVFNFLKPETGPVLEYSRKARSASSKMRSRTDPAFIHKVDVSGMQQWGVDPEMFSGLRKVQWGVEPVTYDEEHKVFRYFTKKAIEDGDYIRDEDGVVRITERFLRHSGQITAYYRPEIDPKNPVLDVDTYDAIKNDSDNHGKQRLRRNLDYFTLFDVEFDELPDDIRRYVNTKTYTGFSTTAKGYYITDQLDVNDARSFKVTYLEPTRRTIGGDTYIPGPLKDFWGMKRVEELVCKGVSRAEAMHAKQSHWQGVSDENGKLLKRGVSKKYWDESKHLVNGVRANVNYYANRSFRYFVENPWSTARLTAVALLSMRLGLKPMEGAVIGAGLELGVHLGFDAAKKGLKCLRAKFGSAASYKGGDCSDLTTLGSIFNVYTRPDPKKIDASKNRVLNFKQRVRSRNPNIVSSDTKLISLEAYITSLGGPGASSTATLPHGEEIEGRKFNCGLVRTKFILSNGDAVYYARYRRDIILDENQEMNSLYKQQLGHGITVVHKAASYMRDDDVFVEGKMEVMTDLSLSHVMELVEGTLEDMDHQFSTQEKAEFLESFKTQFSPAYTNLDYMEELNPENQIYMSGAVDKQPKSSALDIRNKPDYSAYDYMEELNPKYGLAVAGTLSF